MSLSRLRSPRFWLVVALVLLAGVAASRFALRSGHGLSTDYFLNTSGPPALQAISRTASMEEMVAAWKGVLPAQFRARWSGYLNIARAGRYVFATTSDDGSSVAIDGVLVVDNGGAHGAETRSGLINLERGPHAVVVEYSQEGGDAQLQWRWAEIGDSLAAVPSAMLSVAPLTAARISAEHLLDRLWAAALALVSVAALGAAFSAAAGPMTASNGGAAARAASGPPASGAVAPIALWLAGAGVIVGVAAVPAFRPPWSERITLRAVDEGLLVSEPIAHTDTPYVSFASLRFAGRAPTAPDDRAEVIVVGGAQPVSALDDLRARSLLSAIAGPDGNGGLEVRLARPVQFRPTRTVRVAVVISPRLGSQPVAATIGYDGRSPAVAVIRYWWPGLTALFAIGSIFLVSASGRRVRGRIAAGLGQAQRHRPVIAVLLISAGIRLVLAARGGQYFDLDELRYGAGATHLFDLLSTGNLASAYRALLDSPDHPGFRIAGLVPAFVQVLSAWRTGHPISDLRHPAGEWLAAFVLALTAVCSVGLTYLVALRHGASRTESGLAALLLAASTSMLIYARHFFPYDAAMAILLFALWLGSTCGDRPIRSYGAGMVAGLGFLTYEGYWLMTAVVGLVHVLRRPRATNVVIWRGLLFAGGAATLPLILLLSGIFAGRPFLEGTLQFSSAVTHGVFEEGWSLPWNYLWNVEHGLLVIYAAGAIASIYYRFRSPDDGAARGVRWLAAAAIIYAGLIVGSNVLHRFVVYDRLARQLLPFICLGAAAGLSRALGGRSRWCVPALCAIVAALFVVNVRPVLAQRFPREIAAEAIRRFGAANIRLDTTVRNSIDESARTFLPLELIDQTHGQTDGQPNGQPNGRLRRYVLLNARDIWIEGGPPGRIPPPAGTVLLSVPHPRQLRSLQYHGYTPRQRSILRSFDFSMQLIDTGP